MVDGISGRSDYFLLGVLSVILQLYISYSALLWSLLVIPKIQKVGKKSINHLNCNCLENSVTFLDKILPIFCGEKVNALFLNI